MRFLHAALIHYSIDFRSTSFTQRDCENNLWPSYTFLALGGRGRHRSVCSSTLEGQERELRNGGFVGNEIFERERERC